jgi:hypothetical protein
MSIISDAIKKAQEQRNTRVQNDSELLLAPVSQVSAKSKGDYSNVVFIFLTFSLIVGIIATAGILISNGTVSIPGLPETPLINDITEIEPAAELIKIETTQTKSSKPKPSADTSQNPLLETESNTKPAIAEIIDKVTTPPPAQPLTPIRPELPTLAGIMYSETNPKAIVSGEMVSEGDIVDGFTIEEIHPAMVIISLGDYRASIKIN